MIIGVPSETLPGERRVALIPGALAPLLRKGLEIRVQAGAGAEAGFPDAEYEAKGARVVPARREIFAADAIVQVNGYGANPAAGEADVALVHPGQTVIGLMDPLGAPERVRDLARAGVRAFALELMPRLTRAQTMDALSSQATIAGYKAVLLAAGALPRMFPMLMTAAGTVSAARVLVIGAGVAGLQACATARRLGAVVRAFDVRPEVKEQVESVGAAFVGLPLETGAARGTGGYAREQTEEFLRRQRDLMAQVVAQSDVVITTAAVPGARAPVLVTAPMVGAMAAGAVIVDLAAERGGNCELTRPGETVRAGGVTIIGPVNLAATVPYHASQMYARNVASFIDHVTTAEGRLVVDVHDPIVVETLLTDAGAVVSERVRRLLGLPAGGEGGAG